MKTNDYLLVSAVAAYSFLFHTQNPGLNFLIFSALLIALMLIKNKSLIKNPKWCWASVLTLFGATCVFIHASFLSVFANIVSLMLLAGLSFNAKTSSVFSFLFSIYSVCSSIVFVIIDAVERRQKNQNNSVPVKSYKWLGLIIVLVISILFFLLYKNSNPLFAEYTKWINLDFITISWLFFTLGGFFMMYAFIHHKTISPVEKWENNLPKTILNNASSELNVKRLETEKLSLVVLFILLNCMLLLINAGDINTLLLGGDLPEGVKHSDFVHAGVGTLIFSILLADGIIIYFLRGQLNFYKGNKYIKLLIVLWIIQNILMLFSTVYRNHLYISEFTLTHKRIGVYVWLFLAIIGLFLTAYKVYFNKTNWFLIKNNFAVWFTVLVLSASVDWDLTITKYNLQHKKINEIDYYYLFSMSNTNLPEMIDFCRKKLLSEGKALKHREYRNENGYYYHQDFNYMNLLHYKIEGFIKGHKNDRRSFNFRNKRVLNSLTKK